MLLLCLTLLTATPDVADLPAPAPAAPAVVVPAAPKPLDIPTLDEVKVDPQAGEDTSLGWMLLRTLVVLGFVVMLAYVSLNWGMRKLLGLKSPAMNGALVSVLERVPLDQRRSMFVIKAAGEYLLVGGAEQSLSLISKLDTAEVEKIQSAQRSAAPALTLSPFLQKLLARKGSKP